MIISFRFHDSSPNAIDQQGRAYQGPGHINGGSGKINKCRGHTHAAILYTAYSNYKSLLEALDRS